jgi:hypothetical protein
MQIKISNLLRFIAGGSIFLLYLFSLIKWQLFDGIIRFSHLAAYIIVAIIGMLIAGVLYGVLPFKKTIDTANDQLHNGDMEQKKRVVGYVWWLFWGIIVLIWTLPIYINEM